MTPKITRISGPAVVAGGMHGCFMHETVLIGDEKLLGEIILIQGDTATVQVFEDTSGLRVGESVEPTGEALTVELGPGLLGSIFDGIQRPLTTLADKWGDFIKRGAEAAKLGRERKWSFTPRMKKGDKVRQGYVLGVTQETEAVMHQILAPENTDGVIEEIHVGDFTVTDTIVKLKGGQELSMLHKWNIRRPRPLDQRLPFTTPLITGQRVIDTLFPIAEGGSAIVPGGFGTGKTVLEQTIAKFANADVAVYIGCGERGNEMAELLREFPELTDEYTGRPVMERTTLIANTSNMPVAAREASIYTGVTIAEYYRDMGLRVTLMADSTSRWAEALREISSRLEEMPGEEGYPTYLSSRIGAFYERASRARCLGAPPREGSVTVIGAVSPPGGDFSEPVTQSSMRAASTFWSLDYGLAHSRHFPAIDWMTSYSLSHNELAAWFTLNVSPEWMEMVAQMNAILQKEEELEEIAKIVGADAMGKRERIQLEAGRILREGYLRQSSYHATDGFCSVQRQAKMLKTLLEYTRTLMDLAGKEVDLDIILAAPMTEAMLRLKETAEDELDLRIEEIKRQTGEYIKGRSVK